jgi:hypothetical protein
MSEPENLVTNIISDAEKLERLNIYIQNYKEAKTDDDKFQEIDMIIGVINMYNIDKHVAKKALNKNHIMKEIRTFIKRHEFLNRHEVPFGGNRRTKRTKRTTHRKMRKSIIRRRR